MAKAGAGPEESGEKSEKDEKDEKEAVTSESKEEGDAEVTTKRKSRRRR